MQRLAFAKKLRAMLALMLMSSLFIFNSTAFAASQTVVVTGADIARQPESQNTPTKNWVGYYRNAGDYALVTGPATPPLNTGSLQLTTPTGNDKITVFNFDHVGVKLSDINLMGYSTFRSSGDLQQVAAINITIDFNGPAVAGGFDTLIFEPVYNVLDQGAVLSGQWQTWDAFKGGNAIWWSSKTIPGAVAPSDYSNPATTFNDRFVPWSAIVAANPDATVSGYGINEGSGNGGLTTSVDALKFGAGADSITYDFEVNPPGPTPAQCAATDVTQYSIFTFKNASLTNGGSEITGKVAVGGNASFTNYNVATAQPSNQANLFVDGTLTRVNGQVRGQIVNNPTAVDATTAEACAKLTSQFWKNQGGTPVASQYGGFYINASAGTSYFKLKGSELYNANNFSLTAPANTTVIINIDGAADRLQYMGFSLNGGITPNNVVLNFYEANTLLVNGVQVRSTIFAPYAAVTYQNGGLQGSLVSQSVSGGSTRFEFYHFQGAQPIA